MWAAFTKDLTKFIKYISCCFLYLLLFKFLFSSRKQYMVPLDKYYNGDILNKSHSCRFTNIHTSSRIFRHIHTFSGIIIHIQELFKHTQAYSEPCVTLVYFESFLPCSEPGAYSEPLYIQNPEIFRTLSNIYDGAFCENS